MSTKSTPAKPYTLRTALVSKLVTADANLGKAQGSLQVVRGQIAAEYLTHNVKGSDAARQLRDLLQVHENRIAAKADVAPTTIDAKACDWLAPMMSNLNRAVKGGALVLLAGDDSFKPVPVTMAHIVAGTATRFIGADGAPRPIYWQALAQTVPAVGNAGAPRKGTKQSTKQGTKQSTEQGTKQSTEQGTKTPGGDKLTLSMLNAATELAEWLKSSEQNVLSNEGVARLDLVRKAINRAAEIHNTHREAMI